MSKEKISAEGVNFSRTDFTANVVESTKTSASGETKNVKHLDLVADPKKVADEYAKNLPAGIDIQTVKDIASYSKAFLETTVIKSAEIGTDAFNEDKTIDKVNLNFSGAAGHARNEINVSLDRSKTFINIKDPENPIVGPGVSIAVKDVSSLVTGNTKTKMKTYLKENINA